MIRSFRLMCRPSGHYITQSRAPATGTLHPCGFINLCLLWGKNAWEGHGRRESHLFSLWSTNGRVESIAELYESNSGGGLSQLLPLTNKAFWVTHFNKPSLLDTGDDKKHSTVRIGHSCAEHLNPQHYNSLFPLCAFSLRLIHEVVTWVMYPQWHDLRKLSNCFNSVAEFVTSQMRKIKTKAPKACSFPSTQSSHSKGFLMHDGGNFTHSEL